MDVLVQIGLLALGFVLLVKGADWFVEGAGRLAEKFGIPQLVIGLTIVAMGTSLPEAAVSVSAELKGSAEITIGNIVGSNIFNILFVVGTSALITPVAYAPEFLADGIVCLAAVVLLWLCVFRKKRLGRVGGLLMLLGYGGYFVYLMR